MRTPSMAVGEVVGGGEVGFEVFQPDGLAACLDPVVGVLSGERSAVEADRFPLCCGA